MDKIWLEKDLIDTWSLNHFLFGATLPLIFHKLSFGFSQSLIYAVIIFLLWEVIEVFADENEKKYNWLFDVILATAGFLCLWFVYVIPAFWAIILVFTTLEIFGYATRILIDKKHKIFSAGCIATVLVYLLIYVFIIKSF